ncbi:uncharacterized protein LOC144098507 [Amblyomma americanum]
MHLQAMCVHPDLPCCSYAQLHQSGSGLLLAMENDVGKGADCCRWSCRIIAVCTTRPSRHPLAAELAKPFVTSVRRLTSPIGADTASDYHHRRGQGEEALKLCEGPLQTCTQPGTAVSRPYSDLLANGAVVEAVANEARHLAYAPCMPPCAVVTPKAPPRLPSPS